MGTQLLTRDMLGTRSLHLFQRYRLLRVQVDHGHFVYHTDYWNHNRADLRLHIFMGPVHRRAFPGLHCGWTGRDGCHPLQYGVLKGTLVTALIPTSVPSRF